MSQKPFRNLAEPKRFYREGEKLRWLGGFALAFVLAVVGEPLLAQEKWGQAPLRGASPRHQESEGRRLSIREAVTLALEQNLELAIERVNPLIAHERIGEARGAFDPALNFSVPLGRQERPVNSSLEQLARDGTVLQRTVKPDASLAGKLVTGAQYDLSLSNKLLET